VGIGAAVGDFTIDGTELSHITAFLLTVGGAATGDITVDGVTGPQSIGVGQVNLVAGCDGAAIAFTGAASTFHALSAVADDGIVVDVDVTTSTGNLSLDGDADDAPDGSDAIVFSAFVTLESAGSLTLSATTGDISATASLVLLAAGGVTINDGLTTNGVTTIDSDTDVDGIGTFTLVAGAILSTTDNDLSITSADIDLAGALDSGTAVTQLFTSSLGRQIDLGTETIGKWSLTDAELDRITADTIRIGRNDALPSGQITVSDVMDVSGTTRLHLITGAGIDTSGSGAIVVPRLAISAGGL
jgi:hypothetical protein